MVACGRFKREAGLSCSYSRMARFALFLLVRRGSCLSRLLQALTPLFAPWRAWVYEYRYSCRSISRIWKKDTNTNQELVSNAFDSRAGVRDGELDGEAVCGAEEGDLPEMGEVHLAAKRLLADHDPDIRGGPGAERGEEGDGT